MENNFNFNNPFLQNPLIREANTEFQKMFNRKENGIGSIPSTSTDYQFKDSYIEVYRQCEDCLNKIKSFKNG